MSKAFLTLLVATMMTGSAYYVKFVANVEPQPSACADRCPDPALLAKITEAASARSGCECADCECPASGSCESPAEEQVFTLADILVQSVAAQIGEPVEAGEQQALVVAVLDSWVASP